MEYVQEDKRRYQSVQDLLEDEATSEMPASVLQIWNSSKHMWKSTLMNRLFSRISSARGHVCHAEDRNPAKYSSMTEDEVRSALSEIFVANGIRSAEVDAVIRLHLFTKL